MSQLGVSREQALATVKAWFTANFSRTRAGQALGISRGAVKNRLDRAVEMGIISASNASLVDKQTVQFEAPPPPLSDYTAEELIERGITGFHRRKSAHDSQRLIPIKIKIDGPVGIAHFGDPHVDDDGCNWPSLKRNCEIINETDGMLAGNVGDMHNNWVGRLARLYANQSTTAAQAWTLVEWLCKAVPWLYLTSGNHDCWSGNGDPLKYIMCSQPGVHRDHGARMNLTFPNGKEVRINARHDFSGHSMWNTAHGIAKAVQMGWRDHILTCGHTHVSGYQILKDPASGLISHAIRVASFKDIDSYATERGLPDQNIFACPVTIINPEYADNDPRLVTFIPDTETAADYLTFLRARKVQHVPKKKAPISQRRRRRLRPSRKRRGLQTKK